MRTIQELSVGQLKQVVAIKEEIERLQAELESVSGNHDGVTSVAPKRRFMSASAKARIAAAQRLRWAKYRKQSGTVAPAAKKPRRRFSAAARAKLAASAKARWAKAKAAGKSAL